jgi:threonine synthase
MLHNKQTQERYPLHSTHWRSESGQLLDIDFEAKFDFAQIRNRPPSLWRYREAIPITDDSAIISFGEGFTPLQKMQLEEGEVDVKLDFLFPSGSYKDRGASVLLSHIKAIGVKSVVQDSSGNAGASVACYAAKAGVKCKIFVPADTAAGKLAQIALYGAALVKVEGSREATAEACMEAAQHTYYASHVWNPFFLQGTKTFAYEVCEQMSWTAPDAVILPAGNGTLLLGAWIGFQDLVKAGIIEKIPKLIGIQAENCSPLVQAWRENLTELPKITKTDTLAEGISIANPVRGLQLLEAVSSTQGDFLTVNEAEIKTAFLSLAHQGYYVEPTSAAVIAGVAQYLKKTPKAEKIVSVLTGSGLKSAYMR